MERLKGKVAIVTGAGSGIGKVLARRLAEDGASLVIADLRDFDRAAAEIARATGARTLGLQVDVSSETDTARMAAETMKAFGRIDIRVTNAAIFSTLELKPFEKIPVAEWRKVMDVNIMGVAHGTDKQLVLAHKAAIDAHLNQCGIEVGYTNVFWGGRSEIKPSEISPFAYQEWCRSMGVDPESMKG